MKNNILLLIFLFIGGINQTISAQGPTTAYDFKMNDCNGNMHHLFSELDSGNVVVMEFFMISCSPCIVAGHALDEMVVPLKKKYGKKVRFYQIGFTKSYTCSQIQNWVSTNGFATSVPFDSGDVQVAYYGGMGMPTVAVVGGKAHDVLFSSIDFKPNPDTATIAASIHTFFNTTGIQKNAWNELSLRFFPNPASSSINLTLNLEKAEVLHLSIKNLQGQKVAELLTENVKPGVWNKTVLLPQLQNGVYFLQGETGTESFAKKITILNP
jgi:thiol-disulfide isomerase/thioredoxin